MKFLLLLPVGVLLIVLFQFGTLDPCGIVRAQVRQQAARAGEFGALASMLPDGVIDGMLIAQYGPLSPGRCISLAFMGGQPPPTPQPAPPVVQDSQPPHSMPITPQTFGQSQFVTSQSPAEALKQAGILADAAVMECRNRRLSGELKTYVESVQCASPKVIEAYRSAGYRYMDLINLMTAKRLELSEKLDNGKITEAQSQLAYAQFMTSVTDIERQRDRGQR